MLRRLSNGPLSRLVLSKTVLNQARPSLAMAVSRIRDFSTVRRSRAEKTHGQTKKDNAMARQQDPLSHAYSPFSRSINDFIGRPFFARDPFAPFFSDPFFEEFHREITPLLRSPMIPSASFPDRRVQLKETSGDDDKGDAYEITVDIPEGLEHPDLKVELERDGTVVHVSGERHVEEDDMTTTTRFSKRFAIGKGMMDTDNMQAHLDEGNGCLVIRAPKLEPQPQPAPTTRQIDITTKPRSQDISDEELRQQNYNPAFDESDSIETGKDQKRQNTKAKGQVTDEELRQKNYGDAFDESDSIETGKDHEQRDDKVRDMTDEELRQKNYNDAFDESDSIETGKKLKGTRVA